MDMLAGSDFEGKVALVTGGSRGLGYAIAIELAQLGASVVVTSRDESRAAAAAAAIRKETSGDVDDLQLDLCDHGMIGDASARLVEAKGPVSLLVNNASPQPVLLPGLSTSSTVFLDQLGCVVGHYLLSAACVSSKGDEDSLAIVNISSAVGHQGASGLVPYSMAKACVLNMTKSMAKEWTARNVRVNSITPGPIETELIAELDGLVPGYAQGAATSTLVKRLAVPAEVAKAALFLLSDHASYITGADLVVGGGCQLS